MLHLMPSMDRNAVVTNREPINSTVVVLMQVCQADLTGSWCAEIYYSLLGEPQITYQFSSVTHALMFDAPVQ
jgi:hypothetical protein